MKYFPIFLDAKFIKAIVIGGGDVAARKIELLLKTTTNITVMSAELSASVERLVEDHNLCWLKHNYKSGCIEDSNLVIAATDNTEVNQHVAAEASGQGLLTNVVDQPELCTYITPSIIDRDPILIAMSSSGSAPILLRMLREPIEKTLPDGYGKLADFSLKFREHVKARIKGIRNRRTFWENVLRGRVGQLILNNQNTEAEKLLISSLKETIKAPQGEIVFIHTLAGDPDNLTLKAHRELQFADAVFYDETVNVTLIEYVRRDADKYPQSVPASILINFQHALDLAEKGQKVIYLLSGHHELPRNEALLQSMIPYKELVNGE